MCHGGKVSPWAHPAQPVLMEGDGGHFLPKVLRGEGGPPAPGLRPCPVPWAGRQLSDA